LGNTRRNSCWLSGNNIPKPALPYVVREKIAHLHDHGNEYDAVFLGSSRIQNHVMPQVFDALVSERGIPMHSFNFGISAMHTPEDDYLLDLILAQPHGRLRWVFVEIDFFDGAIRRDENGTLRGLYWHDWPRLCSVFLDLFTGTGGSVFRRLRTIRENIPVFFDHAKLFFQRAVNLGRGADLAQRWLFKIPDSALDVNTLGEGKDGWLPAEPLPTKSQENLSASWRASLRQRVTEPPKKDPGDAGTTSSLSAKLKKITAAGATPVWVIPARVRQYYFYPERTLAERAPIIDLCDPHLYPDLYREELHVDTSHLNATGARIFTRILAERFLAVAANQQGAQPVGSGVPVE